MREKIERLREYIEKRIVVLIVAGFLLFIATRILKYSVLDILPSGATTAYIEHEPTLLGIFIFILSIFVVIYCYRVSLKLERRKKIVLIFLVVMLLHVSLSVVYEPIWWDAQGYYDLGVLGAEKGPVYLLEKYHTVGGGLNAEKREAAISFLENLHLGRWAESKLPLDGELNKYCRAYKHPPLWMLTLSFFIFVFGKSHFSAILAEWLISALLPVAIYFLLVKYTDERAATQTTFLFILLPTFLMNSSAPLSDMPYTLLIIISAYFYLHSLESEKRYVPLILSGVLYSFALVTRFESLLIYLPFLILAIIKKGKFGWIKTYGIFFVSSMIVPFLLTFLNYYLFLNAIISLSGAKSVIPGISPPNPFITYAMSLNDLFYYGFPIMVLLLLGVLRLLTSKKLSWSDQFSIVFLFTLLLAFYLLLGYALDRYLLPFLVLVLVLVAKELQNLKVSDTFIGFSIFICAMQIIAYILTTFAAV